MCPYSLARNIVGGISMFSGDMRRPAGRCDTSVIVRGIYAVAPRSRVMGMIDRACGGHGRAGSG